MQEVGKLTSYKAEGPSLERFNTDYLKNISSMIGPQIGAFRCYKKKIAEKDAIYKILKERIEKKNEERTVEQMLEGKPQSLISRQ